MPTPQHYWRSHELTRVTGFGSLMKRLRLILDVRNARGRQWVFRGARDESWGLHSKLARTTQNRVGDWPTEDQIREEETAVLDEARSWKLDRHRSGPLAGLELLAALQHTGSPTRLIDVTHHALVAAWYACAGPDDADGRVFALEVSRRELPAELARRENVFWTNPPDDWQTNFWVWTPPPFEERMARQHGAFLVGGVPRVPPQRWYLRGRSDDRMSEEIVRGLTSIAAYANRGGVGRPAVMPIRTFRIARTAKATLRWQLDVLFDLSERTLYPDLAGFAELAKDKWPLP